MEEQTHDCHRKKGYGIQRTTPLELPQEEPPTRRFGTLQP
jgi:hypothetical protein